MLLKSLLGIRATQLVLSLVFLVSAAWVLYLVRSSAVTQGNPSHIFTTTLRFLLPLLTMPYTVREIFASITILRGRDIANKYTLRAKSRAYKIGRVLFELTLGGLWFLAFVFSLGAGSWALTGDNGASFSSTNTSTSSNTTTPLTDSSASVIPPTSSSTVIVPPGGKIPMVLGSLMWIGLIGLFAISALGVMVETVRNWRPSNPAPAPGKIEEA